MRFLPVALLFLSAYPWYPHTHWIPVLLNLNTLLESSNPLQSNALQKWVCDPTSTPTIKVSLVTCFSLSFCVKFILNLQCFDCFVYIRQDATQSYLEVLFYSIGIISELQECSFPVCTFSVWVEPTAYAINTSYAFLSTSGLFVQKCPDTMLISSTAMLMILAINTIPPIRPPKIQFKAKIPMLPLIPKFFGIIQKHILRIPNGHPTIIQYKTSQILLSYCIPDNRSVSILQ